MTNKDDIIMESYEIKEYNKQKRINLRSNAPFTKGAKVAIIDYDTYINSLDSEEEKQAKKVANLTNKLNEVTETNADIMEQLKRCKERELEDAKLIANLNNKIVEILEGTGNNETIQISELKTKVNYLQDLNKNNTKLYNKSINNIITLAEVIIEKNNLELVSAINDNIKNTNFIKRALGFTINAKDIETDLIQTNNAKKLNESKPVLKIATKDKLDNL